MQHLEQCPQTLLQQHATQAAEVVLLVAAVVTALPARRRKAMCHQGVWQLLIVVTQQVLVHLRHLRLLLTPPS
jgi:hypothetical protein